jgi:hypothetical protein
MRCFIPRSTDGQRVAPQDSSADPAGSSWQARLERGNLPEAVPLLTRQRLEVHMLRGGLLWLIGIPLPIILILFFLGYLH